MRESLALLLWSEFMAKYLNEYKMKRLEYIRLKKKQTKKWFKNSLIIMVYVTCVYHI